MLHSLVVFRTGRPIAREVRVARSLPERLKGLLGSELGASGALVIVPAQQVHTVGMRYPIDVLFCDREWRVLHISRSLRPFRATRFVLRARYAIELPAGAASDVRVGDQLSSSPR